LTHPADLLADRSPTSLAGRSPETPPHDLPAFADERHRQDLVEGVNSPALRPSSMS